MFKGKSPKGIVPSLSELRLERIVREKQIYYEPMSTKFRKKN